MVAATVAVANESFMKQVLNALISGGGVVFSYTVFSILQEEITRDTYGPKKEKFIYMQELVFVQCLAYCFVAFLCKPRGSQIKESVPWYYYAIAAASYTTAMVSSNSALKFVPYPTQVLCKSCKPLPVLLFGVLFASKRYHWRKFLYITLIVAGMAIFMYKPKHSGKFDVLNFGTGEALLLLSLFMDGVTGTVQERMRSGYKTEKYSMMFYMNFFSGVLLSGSIVFSHDLFKFIDFVQRYPFVLQRIALLSIAGACGQVFIFKTVSDFGPLTLSIITTSRKLISVVLSVILFSNPLNQNQKIGTIIVFLALFLDGLDSSRRSKSAADAASVEPLKAKKETPDASGEEEDGFEKVPKAKAPTPPKKRQAVRRE
uniref:Solute carrier family 35 member B1 n=1 Tax=Panagrolaimus superbus TaxID=310955 RepID=A0A914Y1Q2_9BILA